MYAGGALGSGSFLIGGKVCVFNPVIREDFFIIRGEAESPSEEVPSTSIKVILGGLGWGSVSFLSSKVVKICSSLIDSVWTLEAFWTDSSSVLGSSIFLTFSIQAIGGVWSMRLVVIEGRGRSASAVLLTISCNSVNL